ncbi:MAG: IS66 family insertion sequence element accessory protein TnpB [Gammaproteobacteria bacterium]|nr:IS66 family insertion sequence element accessory protein TnpB [Gammaproteobacteria bacterium]
MSATKQTESLSTHWASHLQSWQKTQQSQSAYCRDHELNYHRFTYWRRKLIKQASPARHPVKRSDFIAVEPCSSEAAQSLTATLPNGVLLQGISASNLTVVRQLLGLLP